MRVGGQLVALSQVQGWRWFLQAKGKDARLQKLFGTFRRRRPLNRLVRTGALFLTLASLCCYREYGRRRSGFHSLDFGDEGVPSG